MLEIIGYSMSSRSAVRRLSDSTSAGTTVRSRIPSSLLGLDALKQ